jgi:hypothetical protein
VLPYQHNQQVPVETKCLEITSVLT